MFFFSNKRTHYIISDLGVYSKTIEYNLNETGFTLAWIHSQKKIITDIRNPEIDKSSTKKGNTLILLPKYITKTRLQHFRSNKVYKIHGIRCSSFWQVTLCLMLSFVHMYNQRILCFGLFSFEDCVETKKWWAYFWCRDD